MTCALCGREFETLAEERQAWKQMVGWVSPKGSKAMTASRPTGALAHAGCVQLAKSKLPAGSQSLF